ncbi:MAG: T9SS type A sorting domain-containing protein, partial [Bacteroidota bacterium]
FAGDIAVTFQVNLKVKAKETLFNPAVDSITMHGDFMTDAGLGSNWFPVGVTLKDQDNDSIFTVVVVFPDSNVSKLYHYKFTVSDKAWESDPNREFTLSASTPQILPVEWFDRDSVVNIPVTNTLNFTADLTSIYGSGAGFFDPSVDSIKVEGLDWVGATVTGGVKKFAEDPFKPGIFYAQVIIKGFKGDSTKWKAKAYPENEFYNGGWEVTPDYWYTLKDDGTVSDLPKFTPNVFPKGSPTTKDVTVLFQVNMTGAQNRFIDQPFDISTVTLVGIKGQKSQLGAWVGDWMPSDTGAVPQNLLPLNDKAENGDKVAGDNIWSTTVLFPSGDEGGPSLYKYGAFYPGSDTLNSGYHPGDNEFKDGHNHFFNLVDKPRIEILDAWGSDFAVSVTGVKNSALVPEQFSVSQNFPNPFNPSTTIRYTLPISSKVTLSIYNVLGQEVARVVNAEQGKGTYDITVDGTNLASGMYIYRLDAGTFSMTKKMMLLK